MNKKALKFDEAFERLEAILEKMNHSGVELEEAIHLYEEADTLIGTCSEKLKSAEQKIDQLVKKREGDLDKAPQMVPFETEEL